MARPPPRRSSRIRAIQSPSPSITSSPPPKKRKYYVISGTEPTTQDSDSSVIQVSSRPPYKPKNLHPTISAAAKKHKNGGVSPKSTSKRRKRKERCENEGYAASRAVTREKKKEMRGVAVGPDDPMWTRENTQKDVLDIVQATVMDDITLEIYVRPVTLSKCGHTFCHNCVQTWLSEHSTCPECRSITFNYETFQNRSVQSLCDKLADLILSKQEAKDRAERLDKEMRVGYVTPVTEIIAMNIQLAENQ